MNDTLKKLLVVVSLTVLIWAWAYMSQEKDHPFSGTLEVSPATGSGLLVTFSSKGSSPRTKIPLPTLNLKGAPSRLSELLKRYNLPPGSQNKERLDFYYDPQERTEGTYTLELLDYLQESSKIQQLVMTLESCTPKQVTVNITQLVEKELPVQCVDKDNVPLKYRANSDPSLVKIYVRKGYPVESATVVLSPQQVEMAQKQPVEATPYVELGVADVKRKAASPVQITLQSEERLKQHTFQPTSFRFVMSPKIADSYKIELIDETFTDSTSFMATDKAMDAYKKMPYHILIEIRDEDPSLTEILPRPVIYNFPSKDFKNDDIDIVKIPIPKTATFKLTPISPEVN